MKRCTLLGAPIGTGNGQRGCQLGPDTLRIAGLPVAAVRCAKEAVVRGTDVSLHEGLELERRLAASLFDSDEARQALSVHIAG